MICSKMQGMQPSHPVSRSKLKARGSRLNPKNRFERLETVGVDDGWAETHPGHRFVAHFGDRRNPAPSDHL